MSRADSSGHAFKLASILLQYPTAALFDGHDELVAAATATSPRGARDAFARFVEWLHVTDPTEVAQHYVETFDLRRRCALYLTYFRYGDTRKRGMSMLAFKTAFRAAGYDPADDELPDYLPLVLEFASLTPKGEALLRQHRADVELLRRGLQRANSPYADLVAAVSMQLPRLDRHGLAEVRKAWENGPPAEEVGLEPFAPPEYLRGEHDYREGGPEFIGMPEPREEVRS